MTRLSGLSDEMWARVEPVLRPVNFDAADYRNRNVVGRALNHVTSWRGLATRYDKHALVDPGGSVLAAILLWLA